MGKVVGLCGFIGLVVGSYLPTIWGASSFGFESLLFGAAGGIAGVWLGARLADL